MCLSFFVGGPDFSCGGEYTEAWIGKIFPGNYQQRMPWKDYWRQGVKY